MKCRILFLNHCNMNRKVSRRTNFWHDEHKQRRGECFRQKTEKFIERRCQLESRDKKHCWLESVELQLIVLDCRLITQVCYLSRHYLKSKLCNWMFNQTHLRYRWLLIIDNGVRAWLWLRKLTICCWLIEIDRIEESLEVNSEKF